MLLYYISIFIDIIGIPIKMDKHFNILMFSIFSVSATLPSGQLSNVPWRRSGVKYTNNEAYFDVIEEVDAIIDKGGSTVFAEIQGYVRHFCIINTKYFF